VGQKRLRCCTDSDHWLWFGKASCLVTPNAVFNDLQRTRIYLCHTTVIGLLTARMMWTVTPKELDHFEIDIGRGKTIAGVSWCSKAK